MKKSLLICGPLAALLAVGCSTVKEMPVDALSGEWNVVTIEKKAITLSPDSENPYLAFDVVNSRMFGSVGCNRVMGGLYATDKGTIDLSHMGATRMMCPDMALEDKLLTALNQVKEFGTDKDGNLVLMDGNRREMVMLAKRESTVSPASLVGKWKVNLLGDMDLSANAEGDYIIEFDNDGTFSMTTGCNNVGGNYDGRFVDIAFSGLMSTRMACPDMQVEQAAQQLLPTVVAFSELANPGTYGFYNADNDLVMTISAE